MKKKKTCDNFELSHSIKELQTCIIRINVLSLQKNRMLAELFDEPLED
jgi:hypothetical protein